MKRGSHKNILILIITLVVLLIGSLYVSEYFGLSQFAGKVSGNPSIENTCYFGDVNGDCITDAIEVNYIKASSLLKGRTCEIVFDGVPQPIEVCDNTVDMNGDGLIDSADVTIIRDLSLLKGKEPADIQGAPGIIELVSPSYIDGVSGFDVTLRVLKKTGIPAALIGVDVGAETKYTDINGLVTFTMPAGTSSLTAIIPENPKKKYITRVEQNFCMPICTLFCGEPDSCGGTCSRRDVISMFFEEPQYDDDFTGTVIDTSKWDVYDNGGMFSITQNEKLIMSKGASGVGFNPGNINSINKFSLSGDFSVQIDFNLINFPNPGTTSGNQLQLELRDVSNPLGVIWLVSRQKGWNTPDGYSTWRTDTNVNWGQVLSIGTTTGKMKLERTGSSIRAYYYRTLDDTWVSIGSTGITTGPVYVSVSLQNNNAGDALNVELDNFMVDNKDIVDSSGNNNNGISYGAIQTTGKSGNALNFDGVDDYVEVQSSASLDINKLTTEFWFKLDSLFGAGQHGAFISRLGSANHGWQVTYDGAQNIGVMFRSANGDQLHFVNQPLNINQWYHLAAVYDNDGASTITKLYLDGVLLDTKVHTNQIMGIPTISKLFIATNQDGAPLGGGYGRREIDGVIDEMIIHNRVLTDQEILDRYQATNHLCS